MDVMLFKIMLNKIHCNGIKFLSAAMITMLCQVGIFSAETGHVLSISGTRFYLDGKPFPYTGLSFFNGLYNPVFNASSNSRREWMGRFRNYGITVLRVWCQWDNGDTFVDAGKECTVFHGDGSLRPQPLSNLKELLDEANHQGMCVELTCFAQESFLQGIHLAPPADERAMVALTRELKAFRNVTFQIWNEHSDARVPILIERIKSEDPLRLVTNSPGYGGDLGNDDDNRRLDYLTPHTSRDGRHWEVAPREIGLLVARYGKPVVDDEPARNGIAENGGPKGAVSPNDQILHIFGVWQAGGYPTYHHDMFQTGYGSSACPPSGIPDPAFNPYHRTVLEFIRQQDRYLTPAGR